MRLSRKKTTGGGGGFVAAAPVTNVNVISRSLKTND